MALLAKKKVQSWKKSNKVDGKKIDKTVGLKSQTKYLPVQRDNDKKRPSRLGPENNSSQNNAAGSTVATKLNEKTDWNKLKKEKKDLKLKRKQGKDLFELTKRGKQIYEKLKCKSTPNKDVLVKELHSILHDKTNYQRLVLAHDTARIVQCLLKYSSNDIRNEIIENLKPVIKQMVFSKYAHFCVMRMIKYGTSDIKQKIIEALYGNVVKMCCLTFSSSIVDVIFISWASSQQKSFLRQEFYGDLYKNSKDNSVKSLADTYREAPHMKAAILSATKGNLNHVVNKKLIDNSLVHSVLLDYLTECTDKERMEMIETYSPFIPSLASTRDGVRASVICFWHSVLKDRRAILKNLKEHLIKLCIHHHGYVLILAIINSLDDTKALKKSIFDPIFMEIQTILYSEWGRKIIEWSVAPENTIHFHPHTTAFLESGLKFSKKDKTTRRLEIIQAIEKPLSQLIIEQPTFWLRGGHIGLTLMAVLKIINNNEQLNIVYEKLAEIICNVNWKVNAKETNEKSLIELDAIELKKRIIDKYTEKLKENADQKTQCSEMILGIEHAGLHIVLKKLIKFDRERIANNLSTFSASLLTKLDEITIQKWLLLNRPSFLLLNILENADENTVEKLQTLLAGNLKLLKKQNHVAASLIIKKFK